eukprot:6107745-Amphidinium_carterae.1
MLRLVINGKQVEFSVPNAAVPLPADVVKRCCKSRCPRLEPLDKELHNKAWYAVSAFSFRLLFGICFHGLLGIARLLVNSQLSYTGSMSGCNVCCFSLY